jgi:putative ABC transport system permease protein
MLTLGFKYALRERTRFMLTMGAVASAVVLTVFLVGVYRGAVRGSLSYVSDVHCDVWVGRAGSWNLMRCSGLVPEEISEPLLQTPGVIGHESILVALLPAEISGEQHTLLVIGLEAGASAALPTRIVAGSRQPNSGQILIDRAFSRRHGLETGDSLEMAGCEFRIAGITAETNLLVAQYAFLNIEDLRSLLGLPGQSSFFLLTTEPGHDREVSRTVASHFPQVSAFHRDRFLENNQREVATGFLPVLWAVAVLGLIAGGIVVSLTLYTTVLEKRGDYALLSSMGAGGLACTWVVLQQALAAAIAGCFLGLGILLVLEHLLPLAVPEVEFRLEAWLAVAALLGSVVMASGGALIPARLSSRISPMEVFKR